MNGVLTVLEARVSTDRETNLTAAYRSAADGPFPPGFIRSSLLRSSADRQVWRIATLWESRAALDAMRAQGGTPRGVQIFQAAGAEPTLSIWEVADQLDPDGTA